MVDIVQYKKVKFEDTPEKLIYTGATVGSVTTGGWHKSGGFQSKEMGNSGKVNLVYYYEHNNKMIPAEIKTIILSDDLVKAAKSSKIKEYLDGNSLTIVGKMADTDAAVAAMQLGHKDYAFNIMEGAKVAALPTYEKCRAIVDWLSAGAPSVGQEKKTVNKKGILIGCVAAAVLLGSINHSTASAQGQAQHKCQEQG